MIPVVRAVVSAKAAYRIDRVEVDQPHAGLTQPAEKIRGRPGRSIAVIDDIDIDPFLPLRHQQIAQSDAIARHILEDEIFEVDRAFCRLDRRENGAEAFGAVTQDPNMISGGQGLFGDRFLDREMALQHVLVIQPLSRQQCLALPLGQRAALTDDMQPCRLARTRRRFVEHRHLGAAAEQQKQNP